MEAEVEGCRRAFNQGKTKPLSWRKEQLNNLLRMMDEQADLFVSALDKDLRKPAQEAIITEVDYVRNDVRGVINHFDDWTQDNYVEKNILTLLDETLIHYEPLGVVLILGAWNYPLQLSLGPMAGAIAAGNCVIIKPSELSPATADVILELIPRYLDPECFKVVLGGVPETTELLKIKFDYIFYTGSGYVGKIVRDAANKHLTPCTLELGGKSPTYICPSADIDKTAKRLAWAKYLNLGQTCIAPDYILCHKDVQDKFVARVKELTKQWYGDNPQNSPDLCRIVNRRNFDRLKDILDNTKGTVDGGRCDADALFMEPTLVTNVDMSDSTMQTELFGPILPILTVNSKEEAIEMINTGDKPLALYVFTSNKAVSTDFKMNTSSGSMVVNDAIVHLSVDTLPFGGVGASGMGNYHGKYTFLTFSHHKSILVRDFSAFGEYLGVTRYPPYSMDKVKRMQLLVKNRKIPNWMRKLPYLATFIIGGASTLLVRYLARKYNMQSSLPSWF